MHLLGTFTLPSGSKRASVQRLKLEHPWPNHILELASIRWACDLTGGYATLQSGELSISFSPEMFANDWPPPKNFAALLEYTETIEASKGVLVAGMCHLQDWDREACEYSLYPSGGYTTQLAASTVFNDTLVNVFSWACDAARLNLTLDSTLASATAAVVHTTSSDQLLIDFLPDVAKYHGHLFYIESGTLYLVDFDSDNGMDTASNERTNMQPNSYGGPQAVSMITDGTNPPVFCSYPYGSSHSQNSYETNAANVAAAQAKLKGILEKDRPTLRRVLSGATMPKPGKKFTFTNTRDLYKPVSVTMHAREIDVDFVNDDLIITGEGTVTAI